MSRLRIHDLRSTRRSISNGRFALTAALVALVGGQAGAGQLEESHALASNWHTGGLDFGATYQVEWEVPLFNTMGGTRTLDEIVVRSGLYTPGFEAVIAPNTTDGTVHDTVFWEFQWRAIDSQIGTIFPSLSPTDFVVVGGGGQGAQRLVGFEGETLVFPAGDLPTTEAEFLFDQQFYLGLFSGDGTRSLTSELTVAGPTHWDFPIYQGEFTPGFVTINMDSVRVDFEIVYRYTEVPAPAALGTIGVGAIASLRRRRGN